MSTSNTTAKRIGSHDTAQAALRPLPILDRSPLEITLLPENDAWARRIDILVWAFVALGVVLRVGRYLLRFPLWGDEVMLAGSFLDRGYLDLLRPLDSYMCAPLLFLWAELTAIKLGGFSEWTLRLFPLMSGVASFFLFRHLAARLMRGVPLLFAVGFLAVSYYPIRHASEMRAYASDLTTALILLTLAVEWWRDPRRSRWLWALAAVAPIAVGLSYPAVFAAGGVSLGLAWHVWKFGGRGAKAAFVVYNLALVASFIFFVKLCFEAQFDSSAAVMKVEWGNMGSFPPFSQPLKLPGWLLATHTGEMFAFPFGSDNGGSVLTSACFVVAAVLLFRRGRGAILGMTLGTFGLGLAAGALHRYPYGVNERCVQYLAPSICLFAGLGAGWLVCGLRHVRLQRQALALVTIILIAAGMGLGCFFLVRPYKHRVDLVHRGFAQWFWEQMAEGADVVCLYTDKHANFGIVPDPIYLCYQRIYSPRHRLGSQSTVDSPAPRLRCVSFKPLAGRRDEAAVAAWLAEIRSQFDFVGRQSHQVRFNVPSMPDDVGLYEVFEFARKSGSATDTLARRPKE